MPPKPPWVDQQSFCEAEQTLFASFSGKRRILLDRLVGFWGARPPNPPESASPRSGVNNQSFCEAEQMIFASFSGKRRILLLDCCIFGGHAPQTPLGRLRRVLGVKLSSAKQNKRFLLLFLEKEEYRSTN
jgi:hypothetical protein